MENRIAELKNDLGCRWILSEGGGLSRGTVAIECAGGISTSGGLPGYRAPATIRLQVLTCGAILGRAGRGLVIHLS